MNELERLLRDSLHHVADEREVDTAAARHRFLALRRKRRWLMVGEGALATGMAVLLTVFVLRAGLGDDPGLRVSTSAPRVAATIAAGTSAVGITVGEGAVWMTDPDARTVARIDPVSGEVESTVSLPTEPDEVVTASGVVWVTDVEGTLYRIDPRTTEVSAPLASLATGTSVRFDIAAGNDGIWLVDPATGSVTNVSSDGSLAVDGFSIPGLTPTDVASDGSQVWAYDPAGSLARVDDRGPVWDVPEGGSFSDLALGFGAAWVATGQGGEVYRVDLATGEVGDPASVGGDYTDLALDVSESAVWAVSIDGDAERSQLVRLDPATGRVRGDPVAIDGVAADISAGEGSVWVADRTGAVFQVVIDADDADTDPAPTATPADDTDVPDDEVVMFVYADNGDLYAHYETRVERLTDTPEIESNPAISSDGRHVVFERRAPGSDASELVTLDLTDGTVCCFRPGTEPAIGPDDLLAWVYPSGTAAFDGPAIGFGAVDSAVERAFPAVDAESALPGTVVTELAWDPTGERLYVETEYEDRVVRVAPLITGDDGLVLDMGPAQTQPVLRDGTRFVAPSGGPALIVLSTCCVEVDGEAPTSLELIEITAPGSDDAVYETLAQLPVGDLGLDLDGDLQTASLGDRWIVDTDRGLRVVDSDVPAWLVGDGTSLWIVDAEDRQQRLSLSPESFAAPHPFLAP